MGKVLRRISLAVTLCLMLVFTMKTQVQAQTRIDTLRDGTFINLSRQDKEDTIRAIVSDAASDLGVTRTINVGFYDSTGDYNGSPQLTHWLNFGQVLSPWGLSFFIWKVEGVLPVSELSGM